LTKANPRVVAPTSRCGHGLPADPAIREGTILRRRREKAKIVPYRQRIWGISVKMTTTEERDADRKRSAQKALRREATVKRIKDIVWSAVIASAVTIIVVTSLGWLTTQAVVGKAREQGAKELVSLRASICSVKFQQRPDASAKIAEFKALSYGDRDTAVKKFVAEEKLATMLGEDAPAPGAIDKCADAISNLSR